MLTLCERDTMASEYSLTREIVAPRIVIVKPGTEAFVGTVLECFVITRPI